MWASYYNQPSHLEQLLQRGASKSLRDMDGKSALHWSVKETGVTCLQMLLTYENSFDVDQMGKTVMHYAAERGSKKLLRSVAQIRPLAIHDIDNNGRTPAHWAAVVNNPVNLRALRKLGASWLVADKLFKTPFDYAHAAGHEYCCAVMTTTADSAPIVTDVSQARDRPSTVSVPASTYVHAKGAYTTGEIPQAVKELARILSIGSHLSKFTNNGEGKMHTRYFWLNVASFEICWVKSTNDLRKENLEEHCTSLFLRQSNPAPADVITGRSDYDATGKHRFAFSFADEDGKLVHVVAPTEESFKLWTQGLQYVKAFAESLIHEAQYASNC
jgi:hypothetical protein